VTDNCYRVCVCVQISTGRQDLDVAIQTATSREAQKLGDKLTLLQHQMEHQLASVNDNIKAAIKKIQDQEADNKRRIEELEKKLGTMVRHHTLDIYLTLNTAWRACCHATKRL
jgi:hypothetical protein